MMAIIAILYYSQEMNDTKKACKKDLQSTLLQVERDIRQACMGGYDYSFEPFEYKLNVGLFDIDKKLIASNLEFMDIDFNKTIDIKRNRVHMLKKFQGCIQGVSFIVAEDVAMTDRQKNLKLIISSVLLFSLLFVAFVGYLLSKILLKPQKKRIIELNKFIKDAMHEINTPVTALLMSVSQLKKKDIKEQKLLRNISISSKQIATIYNTLSSVSFSDLQKENIEEFDLKEEVVRSVTFFEEIAASKNIKIESKLLSLKIKMDRQDASSLINNLLSNAIKYSFANTTITIGIKDKIFYIKDEGIGIKDENKEEIVKRYTRASDIGGGFGIGLDIVNSICKKYDISLDIESKVGKGSLFTLDFSKIVL